MRKIKIDVWTDVVCPWCLIGSARLDKAISELPADVDVEVENHPFYLDPNTPPEGYDVGEMLSKKYGREPREIWSRAEEQARLSGIDLYRVQTLTLQLVQRQLLDLTRLTIHVEHRARDRVMHEDSVARQVENRAVALLGDL